MSAGPSTQSAVRGASFEPLLALAHGGSAEPGHAPLFCVHPAAGVGWEYSSLVPHLPAGSPLYALQAPGLQDPDALPETVEQVAEDYLRRIRTVQPAGPYHLLGWSFGGAVAHSMVTTLRAQGEDVGLLAILDWYPYDPARPQDEPSEHEYLLTLLENLGCTQDRIRAQAGWPVDRDGALRALLSRGHVLDFLDDERLAAILRVFLHHVGLRPAHVPEVFDGPLSFFRAAAEPCTVPGQAEARTAGAWQPYVAGPIRNHDIEVEHRRMLQRDPAAQIGPLLAAALRAQDQETGAHA